MPSYNFSSKFYIGIFFILLSFTLGKIATITFVWYFTDATLRWLSVGIYILSWPLLIVGIIWVGKEYAQTIQKYISYQYYHETIKSRTQKAFYKTKEISQNVHEKVKNQLDEIKKKKIILKEKINKRKKSKNEV